MNYKFSASVIVDASSEEDALSKIAGRISTIARHLGNGEPLAKNKPFFTIEKSGSAGAAQDMWADPIVESRRPTEREAVVLTSADVGTLKISGEK